MLERHLWALREDWLDITIGPILQKLYLQLREWNYEESALRTKQLTGGVGAKPCAAIYGGLTFMCILVSFYNCCFLFLFGFVRNNAFIIAR